MKTLTNNHSIEDFHDALNSNEVFMFNGTRCKCCAINKITNEVKIGSINHFDKKSFKTTIFKLTI